MYQTASEDCMLTTFDNPINPFTHFILWWKLDLLLGHDCCGLLARTANISMIESDAQNEKAIDEAMEYIVRQNPTIYKIVTEDDYMN